MGGGFSLQKTVLCLFFLFQKLYEADKRTRLCCWEFVDVNLLILADESMNGPDKVIPAMKRIDKER
jgi:hypothetical protein